MDTPSVFLLGSHLLLGLLKHISYGVIYLAFKYHSLLLIIIAAFTGGTYLFAGFMREQVCFWLCPYARLQGVMYDQDTVLPAYDAERGEPRARVKKDDDFFN